jgi:hypothetical protein
MYIPRRRQPPVSLRGADLRLMFIDSIWDKLTELGYGNVVEEVKKNGMLYDMLPFDIIPTWMVARKLTAGGKNHLIPLLGCLFIWLYT